MIDIYIRPMDIFLLANIMEEKLLRLKVGFKDWGWAFISLCFKNKIIKDGD